MTTRRGDGDRAPILLFDDAGGDLNLNSLTQTRRLAHRCHGNVAFVLVIRIGHKECEDRIMKLSQNSFLSFRPSEASGDTSEATDEVNLAGTALLDLEGEIPRLRCAPLGMTTLF